MANKKNREELLGPVDGEQTTPAPQEPTPPVEGDLGSPLVPADRAEAAVQRLVDFNQALDTYLTRLVPEDSLIWVQSRDGAKKPVLTRTQYARIFRGLQLTEPDEPKFSVRELAGVLVFECTTRVVWPAFGLQAYGVGCAGTDEVDPKAPLGRRIHDAKAKAHTRAWERAVANLIGLGALGEEEAEGHPELEVLPNAVQFILNLAAKKGIPESDVRDYVQARWGEKLSQLTAQKAVILKSVVESVPNAEAFRAEIVRWKGGA